MFFNIVPRGQDSSGGLECGLHPPADFDVVPHDLIAATGRTPWRARRAQGKETE
jgi:hypothetical protein